jgi:hypothetical protein
VLQQSAQNAEGIRLRLEHMPDKQLSTYRLCVVQFTVLPHKHYTKTAFIRFNWDGNPSEYAEDMDNLIFL